MQQYLFAAFVVLYALFGVLALTWIATRGILARMRRRSEASTAPGIGAAEPRRVITLVHGTWAGHAAWTRASSPLSKAILRDCPGPTLLVPFFWSGRNWSRSRAHAAARLTEHIAAIAAQFPASPHVVVAHSHGGNVAMYAARAEAIQAALSGIVCLSTPFLHTRRRNLGPIAGAPILAAVVVAGWIAFGQILRYAGAGESSAIVSALAAALLLAFLLTRWATAAAERLVVEMALPSRPVVPTLIVRATGDEASGALAMMHFLGYLVSVCWIRPARLAAEVNAVLQQWGAGAGRHTRLALVAVGVSVAAFALDATYGPFWEQTPLRTPTSWAVSASACLGATALLLWWVGTGGGLYGWLLQMIVAGLLLPPFLVVVLALIVPFGPDLALAALHLEVSAEATPPGHWTVHHVGSAAVSDGGAESPDALMHSTYDNPQAIRTVTEWIRQLTP